ncbi:hypothetical protein ACL02T_29370 [Pseudonocardia sp. RS010]|uniref:hypothetical protein n=1 Tax=Pseudonocardia sp. RS010 TaxID=3385979 RepID=UPI00399F5CFF
MRSPSATEHTTARALFMGLLVVVTALLAREFGGRRGAQALAAGCVAVSAIVLQTGHLLSTTTCDLLVWAVTARLAVRALPTGGPAVAARRARRGHRAAEPPVACAVLAVLVMATGGKPYYLCGLYPVLLAAGAAPVLRWARAGRAGLLAGALALSALTNAVLMLPVVPVAELKNTPVTAMVADVG